jgi:hypothetical protein
MVAWLTMLAWGISLLAASGAVQTSPDGFSEAMRRGDLQEARAMLQADPALANKTDAIGRTPLARAARDGQLDMVELLLSSGADVNGAGPDSATPIYEAAEAGHLQVVRRLLSAGAEANKGSQTGGPPLFGAIRGGHGDVVGQLLASGADVNAKAPNSSTPLLEAAVRGDASIVTALLDAGAKLDVRAAAALGKMDLAKEIVLADQAAAKGRRIVSLSADLKQEVEGPLHWACRMGNKDIAQFLVANGAELEGGYETGPGTPLAWAIQGGNGIWWRGCSIGGPAWRKPSKVCHHFAWLQG